MLHGFRLAGLAFCAAALLLTAPATAADCEKFAGLKHCSLGEAGLSLLDGALQVSNVGEGGNDGVAVTLPETRDWEAGVRFVGGDSSPRVTVGAAAGDEEISRAELVATDDGIQLSATFIGSDGPGTYSILVYRDGSLVGSQGGVGAGQRLNIDQLMDLLMEIWHLIGFHNRVANGACVWTLGFAEPVRLIMPDGTEVSGDEVQLVEEVGDGGHYPYVAFDGITLRSSRNVEIVSEEIH